MSIRTVTKIIVSCDRCGKDLLDDETDSPALFATLRSAVEAVADLSGECWGPWMLKHDGTATYPHCRPKCKECGEYIDTVGGECDDPWERHDDDVTAKAGV